MTSQEAYQGIRRVEALYGDKFLPVDLHAIWSSLLQLPVAALNHAVGEMQMIWKRMPTCFELLDFVRGWSNKLELKAVAESSEASDNFALTIGFLEQRISEAEYIKGLYALSTKYGNPEYAQTAALREANRARDG